MNWVGWLFVVVWGFGWLSALHETQTDGGWFKKWIAGPVIMFFVWPYVAWCMMRQMG